jgi:hypothetical protein
MTDSRRYARQMRIAEIGESGQRRLAAATAAVSGETLAHGIATAYAERAGIEDIRAGIVDPEGLAPPFLEHPAARAVVAGARAALSAMRAALFETPVSRRRS